MRWLAMSVAVLMWGWTGCSKPDPEAIIARCDWNSLTCHVEAEELCEMGAVGTTALQERVSYPSRAPEHMKSLVAQHALCTATASGTLSEEMLYRLSGAIVDSKDTLRRSLLLQRFPPAVQLQIAESFEHNPILVVKLPEDERLHEQWCRVMPMQLAQMAQTDRLALAPLFSHHCGKQTDLAISALVHHIEVPFVAHEDELRVLHPEADARRLKAAMDYFRRATKPGLGHVNANYIYLVAQEKIGTTEAPWLWFKPIVTATRACDNLKHWSFLDLFEGPRKWTKAGKIAFAEALGRQQKRCRTSMDQAWWTIIGGLGDEAGLPLAVHVHWPRGWCGTLASALAKAQKESKLVRSDTGKWSDSGTDDSLELRAYLALEAEGLKKCPAEFKAATTPATKTPTPAK